MPKKVEVAAKGSTKEVVATAYVMAGETAMESIELFGDEAVNSNAIANWKITVRGALNRYLKAGKTPEEAVKMVENAKMGISLERVSDPKAALMASWSSMSDEARKELLAELKAAS